MGQQVDSCKKVKATCRVCGKVFTYLSKYDTDNVKTCCGNKCRSVIAGNQTAKTYKANKSKKVKEDKPYKYKTREGVKYYPRPVKYDTNDELIVVLKDKIIHKFTLESMIAIHYNYPPKEIKRLATKIAKDLGLWLYRTPTKKFLKKRGYKFDRGNELNPFKVLWADVRAYNKMLMDKAGFVEAEQRYDNILARGINSMGIFRVRLS